MMGKEEVEAKRGEGPAERSEGGIEERGGEEGKKG